MANVAHRTLHHAFPWNLAEAKSVATKFSDQSPVGDGATSNTTKFSNAVDAALSAPKYNGYHILYLDTAGRFLIDNPVFTGVSDLMILGDKSRTCLVEGSTAWMSFVDCSNISLLDLDWDLNGISAFGGIRTESIDGLWFRGNHVFDSQNHLLSASGEYDRFAIANTISATQNHNYNVLVEHNHFEDCQPSFGPIHHFGVNFNTITRGGTVTAGMGFWANADTWGATDGRINFNRFVDCRNSAIAINKDVASAENTVFQNLLVYGNEMDFYNASPMGIYLGTNYVYSTVHTDTFKDIWIAANKFRYHSSCPLQSREAAVINTIVPYDTDGLGFDNLHVIGNEVHGGWRVHIGINLLRAYNSFVQSNRVYQCRYSGISVGSRETGDANLRIEENVAEALGGDTTTVGLYSLINAHGNVLFRGNRYIGTNQLLLKQDSVDGTGNTIDTPTSANGGGQQIHFQTYGNDTGQQWNPAELADGAYEDKDWTVLGVEPGDHVISFSMSTLTAIGWRYEWAIPSSNTITIRLINGTGETQNLGVANPYIIVEKATPPAII